VISQVLRKCGQWSVTLRPDAPAGLVGGLSLFGHVVVVPARMNPVERGEEMVSAARYVGVLHSKQTSGGQVTLAGLGLEAWLGDDQGKGEVIEHPAGALSGVTFAAAIRAVLPASGAVVEGTIYPGVPGTYNGNHAYQTPRTAVDYVCDTMGGEWRVNRDCTLDAGPAASLFNVASPSCVIVRKDPGYDVGLKALPGAVDSTVDAKEYTTRVVLVAAALAGGTADAATVPYKDFHGNPVVITRVIDEQDDTLIANAPARAAAALAATNVLRTTTRLTADEFDIAGDFAPGDAVWVYDPAGGVFDTANEVLFRGQTIHPVKVRVTGMTWPVVDGYTVAYRSGDGVWTDLTPWVAWEPPGGGEVEVSDTTTSPLLSGFASIGTQVAGGGGGMGDTAVPGVPVFGAFTTTSYQPDDGLSRASVKAAWAQPTNTDGSTIVDGDRYEVRYRPTGTVDWQVMVVPFDQTSATVTNLPPSTGFDWQIRAVDYATPTNYGAWSTTTTFATADDTTAPGTPAAPSVAASLIAVQVTHTLGLAAGGTFNLPLDMDHLEIHLGSSSGFTPDASSLAGKLQATGAMVSGGVAAVGTFPTAATAAVHVKVIAVDRTGNRSPASSAASATALLVDTAHISDLTASKITAGTMSATYVLAGLFRTAASGNRVEVGTSGIETGVRLYNPSGVKTVDLDAATGNASIAGTFRTGLTGQRIEIDATGNGTIYFYPPSGSDYAFINAPSQNSCGVNAGFGGGTTRARMYVTPTVGELTYINAAQAQAGGRVSVNSGGAALSGSLGGASVTTAATSASIDAPAGGQVFAGVASGPYMWARAGDMDIQGNTRLWLLGDTVELGSGGASERVKSLTIYNNTSTFSANVGIATTPVGTLWRLTSSARYKTAITPADLPLDGLRALAPVTYYDRSQAEEAGGTEGLSQQLGLIAEQVHAIPSVGPLLVEYNDDGDPESINYDRVAVALLPWLRDLEQRVRAIEGNKPLPAPRPVPRRILDLSRAPRLRVSATPLQPNREDSRE